MALVNFMTLIIIKSLIEAISKIKSPLVLVSFIPIMFLHLSVSARGLKQMAMGKVSIRNQDYSTKVFLRMISRQTI